MALESKFKKHLKERMELTFPGCIVVHLDPNDIQGIPDLCIFYGEKWATLEGKRSISSNKQPNQEYYVNQMNEMSFSRFIFPEIENEVMEDLYNFFEY